MLKKMLRKKPIGGSTIYDHELHRALNALDLVLMGIGAIIGAGVFVLTGIAAATQAGPAVVLSYMVAGFVAMLAALSYAELASSIGTTGSAYSYAYAGFGEFFAWIIGWDLLLEYTTSVATVAIGWSGYVVNFLQAINIHLPVSLTNNPFEGGIINLIAVAIILTLALLLCIGIKYGARVNAVVVLIKLITITIFIVVAIGNIDVANWHTFFPFGFAGVISGAALVFFAYIGFDALSTAVEETINPQRDIPIGIIASLIICTSIYIIVAGLLTLITPYTALNVESPVAYALLHIGYKTAAGIVAAGAVAGLTTVMLVMYYGLTRITLAMSRDGLLPLAIAKVNRNTRTPIRIILLSGIVMALIAGFTPIARAAELVNIGTLAAFTFVCAGVIVFRYTHPDLERPFRLPYSPTVPLLGMVCCIILMLNLPLFTWERFIGWMIMGLVIYFFYSQNNSLLK